ncbi:MAG: 16S rRNA (cytosine(967)-C(5))-methyltransferase RsmB [Bacilli bacterium]
MNVRKLALEAIVKIVDKGGYSNIVVNEYLTKYELPKEEKALFTILVLGTVEKMITLDYYLEDFLKKKQKPWVINLLRMGIYQLVFLNIPEHAVVNETVEVANTKDKFVGKFVNAVFRSFLRAEVKDIEKLEGIEYLSVKYSYPQWLVSYLLKDYSYNQVIKIFEENEDNKKTSIRVNTLKSSNEEVIKILEEDGIEYSISSLVENGIIVNKSIISHSLFINGKITVQDIASQKVSEVINPQHESKILDLCSAPGGKTMHLASIMENTGEIYACDIHEHKIKLMKSNFRKLGVNNVKLQLVDARNIRNYVKKESFDYILADLPCSGLGVLGHKVDLKYNINLDSIEEIITLQEEILETTKDLVKVGGYYVYSTCTINKKENEEQIEKFLLSNDNYEKVEEVMYLPYEHHTDGFYICKMRRNR